MQTASRHLSCSPNLKQRQRVPHLQVRLLGLHGSQLSLKCCRALHRQRGCAGIPGGYLCKLALLSL
eukprot:1138350-Pelagomonas_calceolata.AAC.3